MGDLLASAQVTLYMSTKLHLKQNLRPLYNSCMQCCSDAHAVQYELKVVRFSSTVQLHV